MRRRVRTGYVGLAREHSSRCCRGLSVKGGCSGCNRVASVIRVCVWSRQYFDGVLSCPQATLPLV
jgi:hypothetical protein